MIIIARFIPVIRTFAPFVTGVGTMKYIRFISYIFIRESIWVICFLSIGFFFGHLPFIIQIFLPFVSAIIFFSIIPTVI